MALALFIMSAPNAQAFDPVEHVVQTTARATDYTVVTGAGYFYGLAIATDGTNNCTLTIYDDVSGAASTLLVPTFVATTSATNRITTVSIEPPVAFNTGVCVDITCAGTVSYIVYYRKQLGG